MDSSSVPARHVPLLSPAEKRLWSHFLADATQLDATGFPVRGSFGFCFSCFTDLSVAPSDEARKALATEAIYSAYTARGESPKPGTVTVGVTQLLHAYNDLQPGQIVAFKKGASVVAIAQIVSPYRYEAARVEAGGYYPHRWDYVILRKARPEESAPRPGCLQTYYPSTHGHSFLLPEEPAAPVPAPSPVPAPAPVLPEEPVTAPISPARAALIAALVDALSARDEAEAALVAAHSRVVEIQHLLMNS